MRSMQRVLIALATWALASVPAQAAGDQAAGLRVLVQSSGQVEPYDLGFAFQAGELCPDTTLAQLVADDIQARDQFKRGVAMFDHYVATQSLDGACKAAERLYSSKTGKVAQLLDQSSGQTLTAQADGKRKINLADRQRMLSQYMAKSVCFASLGVDTATQTNESLLTAYLFGTTLNQLRKGSSVQEMLSETDPAILAALSTVQDLWKPYSKAVLSQDLGAVTAQNMEVFFKTNDAVQMFQTKYGSKGVIASPIIAALSVSGRLRMLTQKASKEFCFIASKQDVEENRINLRATMNLFEKSMRGLRSADIGMGLEAAPNGRILEALNRLNGEWAPLQAIFNRVLDGKTPKQADIEFVARQNVEVMTVANGLVDLYEQASK